MAEGQSSLENEMDLPETTQERILHKVGGFLERNRIASVLGTGFSAAFLNKPPESVGDAAMRLSVSAGLLGVGSFLDRKIAQDSRRRDERRITRDDGRNNTR